jgi:GTP-binding protein HflX
LYDTRKTATATIIVHPRLKARTRDNDYGERSRLEEARGLAAAIHLHVLHAETVTIAKPNPATYLGEGTVERLGDGIKEMGAELVIVDGHLSPGQQRNLERAWNAKVIDRTGLILEIFGERARTREGQLQVELAHLTYQKSRLVRSWTHLERQRGGFGFLGGPGETQIEIDRRLIGERISRLKKELETVVRTRSLHREARRRVPYPIVALVGYTNAGKSTLFNTLTDESVVAMDQLFATLDPTMRQLKLPTGRTVILSDTVGFVSDLPHELVAAFRATLEEVLEADVIVHVRDVAHPESDAQKRDVEDVLKQLGIDLQSHDADHARPVIEALNKMDLLDEIAAALVAAAVARIPNQIAISALTGLGTDELRDKIDDVLSHQRRPLHVAIPLDDGETLAWIYRRGEVLNRADDEAAAHLEVLLDEADLARLKKRGISPNRAAG